MSNSTRNCIYRITCLANGKNYIGQARDFDRRMYRHYYDLAHKAHFNELLQADYDTFGDKQFYSEIIESGVSDELMDERECHWIRHFDSRQNGYNINNGGKDGSKKTCAWNGVEYDSLNDCAKALGLSPASISRRLKRGYSSDSEMPIHRQPIWSFGVKED